MPLHLPKLFKIKVEEAVRACGDGESLWDVLDTLKYEGVIESWETILELRIHRDKVAAIENFFLLKDFASILTPIKKPRGRTDD